jgi:hypothetical protein
VLQGSIVVMGLGLSLGQGPAYPFCGALAAGVQSPTPPLCALVHGAGGDQLGGVRRAAQTAEAMANEARRCS